MAICLFFLKISLVKIRTKVFSEIENGLFVYVNILPFVRSIVNIHLPGKVMRSGKRWPFAARNVANDEAVCGLLRCKRLPLRP